MASLLLAWSRYALAQIGIHSADRADWVESLRKCPLTHWSALYRLSETG